MYRDLWKNNTETGNRFLVYVLLPNFISILDSRAALANSNPNALRAMQEGTFYHFYDGLWYDPAGTWTHDLPCKRRTR